MLQIAQSTVNDFQTVERGRRSKIRLFNKDRVESAEARVARHTRSINSAPNNTDIKMPIRDFPKISNHDERPLDLRSDSIVS